MEHLLDHEHTHILAIQWSIIIVVFTYVRWLNPPGAVQSQDETGVGLVPAKAEC